MDIFEHFEYCFRRLETYTKVPPTSTMMEKMGEITVGVFDVLAIATKEINVRQRSKPIACITIIEADL